MQRNSYNWSRLMTKPIKWPVRPAKTQISLGIRPDWSESLLSTWRNYGSLATHRAPSEDSDQTGQNVQADLSLWWAHKSFCWFCHAAAHSVIIQGLKKCCRCSSELPQYNVFIEDCRKLSFIIKYPPSMILWPDKLLTWFLKDESATA